MSHWDFSHPTDEQHDGPRRFWQADAALSAGAAGPPGPLRLPRLADLPHVTELPDQRGVAEDGGRPARDAWPAPQGRAPNSRPPSAGAWPPDGNTSVDGQWPDDGWDEDEGTAPYPLTYERDDYTTADPQPAAPPGDDPWEPWPPPSRPEGHRDADPGGLAAGHLTGLPEEDLAGWTDADCTDGAARRGGRRWLLPAGVAVAGAAIGAAAALLASVEAGSALHLDIPGFYSPSQSLPRAGVSYLEQFAAYDPPAGGGAPRVVADYSGITGRG